jgi:hypothetical protein
MSRVQISVNRPAMLLYFPQLHANTIYPQPIIHTPSNSVLLFAPMSLNKPQINKQSYKQ